MTESDIDRADHQRAEAKDNPIVQGSKEWLEARTGLITASMAGAVLGLDKNTSAKRAWRIICGTEPEQADNPYMKYGRDNEARAASYYQRITNNVCRPGGFHPHYHLWWLAASPDRLIGDEGCAEIKCPGTLPTTIPIPHLIQCKIQLACTGRQWADYFAWLRTGEDSYDFFLRRVNRSGIDGLLRRLWAWYQAHVIACVEPGRKKPKKRKRLDCVAGTDH